MEFPSRLIENAITEFTRLPGIGKKTAIRLVFYLLSKPETDAERFGNAIITLRKEIKYCRVCHNVADYETCSICANPSRNQSLVCVVENFRDVIAIENTGQYNGLYHVLGGIISPVDGVGPEDINAHTLIDRAAKGIIKEAVMALSPTMEGDTTIFYLSKKLAGYNLKITTIARGVAFGGELEYTDDLTLARSITHRIPYENYLINNG